MTDKELKLAESILNDILSSILKREDAPFSSQTHLDSAICNLLKLLPNFKTEDEEKLGVIRDAVFHINTYRSESTKMDVKEILKKIELWKDEDSRQMMIRLKSRNQ